MSRIALTVFGTAGDVLPCIPVAVALQAKGHQISFVTPRWLGLLPRTAGLPTISVGDGREKRALTDTSMYTTRFDGMASWRRCMTEYVYPTLRDFYDTFLGQIQRFAPDLVVTTALGYWGSLAATELGIPWSSFHLYPQLFGRSKPLSRFENPTVFARPLAQWLMIQEGRLQTAATKTPVVDWSVSPSNTVCGHDPAVIDFSSRGIKSLGFPYWDNAFLNGNDSEPALDFLRRSGAPRVIVCLGSFIGFVDTSFWRAMSDVAAATSYNFLFVGTPEAIRSSLNTRNVFATSNIALSSLLSEAELLMHHGGIGTTYAAFNAGVPSLVLPHAFDQTYNGRLVERLGVGEVLESDPMGWSGAVTRVARNEQVQTTASDLARRLVSAEGAAVAIANQLITEL